MILRLPCSCIPHKYEFWKHILWNINIFLKTSIKEGELAVLKFRSVFQYPPIQSFTERQIDQTSFFACSSTRHIGRSSFIGYWGSEIERKASPSFKYISFLIIRVNNLGIMFFSTTIDETVFYCTFIFNYRFWESENIPNQKINAKAYNNPWNNTWSWTALLSIF